MTRTASLFEPGAGLPGGMGEAEPFTVHVRGLTPNVHLRMFYVIRERA